MIKIGNTNPHAINLETQGIMLQLPSEAPDGKVVLPRNPTLHDISQTYVAAYCKLTGTRAPELHMDYWDKGLTKSGKEDVIRAVDIDALRGLSLPLQQAALSLLVEWHADLDEKLRALKSSDGCSGCFERHANSRAVERHLSWTMKRVGYLNGASFLRAAQRMDLAALQEWIAEGVDVNTSDYSERTTALIAVLENEAANPETRRKIDECAFYLLSLPGIDPCQRGPTGNAYGVALQGGHESIAEYLIKTYPSIVVNNGLGATMINMAARRCPRVLEHLKHCMIIQGKNCIQTILELYTKEASRVRPQDRAPSRAFYLEVISEIIKADSSLGRRSMDMLVDAAILNKDLEMREAATRWLAENFPDVLDPDVLDPGSVSITQANPILPQAGDPSAP